MANLQIYKYTNGKREKIQNSATRGNMLGVGMMAGRA